MSQFNTHQGAIDATMEINGCKCILNSPKAKKDSEAPTLPPYQPRKAYSVDEYEGCPDTWMHGSPKAASYFTAVEPEHGLWLDFNQCWNHTHHIAALVSIQGVNPITGMPLIDTAMRLEQYREKCPKHDKEFGADLFCEECGYKWAPQNYLTTTNPDGRGQLWLDGFRADDGSVRQYYFTEEEIKGVATQIIGDKRVYAIGVAFYRSKERKPEVIQTTNHIVDFNNPYKIWGTPKVHDLDTWKSKSISKWKSRGSGIGGSSVGSHMTHRLKKHVTKEASELTSGFPTDDASSMLQHSSGDGNLTTGYDPDIAVFKRISIPLERKQLEIGAGAKINQKIYRDPETLDFWEDAPIGMLYINYVQESEAKRIIAIGKKDLTKKGEGFLAELVTGNK